MTAPATCTVSGTIYAPDGDPAANLLIRVRLGSATRNAPAAIGAAFIDARAQTTYTDNQGAFSFVLPQGMAFFLECPAADLIHCGIVPAESTAELSTIDLVRWA